VMKALSVLLIMILGLSSAHAGDDLDLLMSATQNEVAQKIEARKQEIRQLQDDVQSLRAEIDFVKEKIKVTRYIRNATMVISVGLAMTVGVVMKRNILSKFRAHPIGVRIVGTLVAATGVVATGGASYGHYLVVVKTKDLSELGSRLDIVENDLQVELAQLTGGEQQP
jgi:hypothetical protein